MRRCLGWSDRDDGMVMQWCCYRVDVMLLLALLAPGWTMSAPRSAPGVSAPAACDGDECGALVMAARSRARASFLYLEALLSEHEASRRRTAVTLRDAHVGHSSVPKLMCWWCHAGFRDGAEVHFSDEVILR